MNIKPNITIHDFNAICRLCLKRERRLKPIFKSEASDAESYQTESVPMNQMVNVCIGIHIRPDDGLPLLLCGRCANKLIDCHSFRMQCLATDNFLKSIITPITKEDDELFNNDWFDHTEDLHQNCIEETPELKPEITENVTDETKTKPTTLGKDNNAKSIATLPQTVLNKKCKKNPSLQENDEKISVKYEKINKEEHLDDTHAHRKRKSKRRKYGPNEPPRKRGRPGVLTPEEILHRKRTSRQGICTMCGKYTVNVKSHMRVHNPVSVECNYCNQKFSSKQSLLPHFKTHFNPRKYQCTMCSYSFLNRCHLKCHLLTHTDKKPFKCDICSKTFRMAYSLKYHKKSHFRIQNVPCPYCEKMFSSKSNLKSHIGIHTGEKPYKCDICEAAFVASSSLAVHRRVHKRDNMFINQCKMCQMILEDRARLKSHLRNVHGINPNEM